MIKKATVITEHSAPFGTQISWMRIKAIVASANKASKMLADYQDRLDRENQLIAGTLDEQQIAHPVLNRWLESYEIEIDLD